jgi:dihydrofolate reductase
MTTTTTKPVRFGFNTYGQVIHKPSDGSRNITLIAAVDQLMGIGKSGDIPWRLSEDLKQFKRLTEGHVIIMGRKTQESLPHPQYLKGRRNIVVSASESVTHPMVETASSLEEAIDQAGDRQIFIIGGESIYTQAMQYADDLVLTHLDHTYDCDRFFPVLDLEKWNQPDFSSHESNREGHILKYRFAYYTRRPTTCQAVLGGLTNECLSGSTGSITST